MKIGQPVDIPLSITLNAQAAQSRAMQSAPAAVTANRSASSAGVAVTVSTLARTMEQSKSGDADVDTAKVNAVRTAIANGTYAVNPGAIADKLLSNAHEMLSRSRV